MNSSAVVPLYSASGCARTAAPAVFRRRFSNAQRPTASPSAAPRVLSASGRENQTVVVWMLGVALCFLSVGFAGVAHPVVALPVPASLPSVELPPEVPVQDLTMADFEDTPEEPDAAPPAEAPAAEDTQPGPEPVLIEADVVEIPPAPEIEPALRVLDPLPEKAALAPRPEPQPSLRPAVSRIPSRPVAAPPSGSGTPGGTGTAGTAKAGRGGKGKFPKPPYPAFAKKAGLTGTVTLSVRVAADGVASSVSVSGSSGSSQLDSYAASWVQSRWRWPSGEARSFRLPVRFQLR